MTAIRCPDCGRRAQRITKESARKGGLSIRRRRHCLYCGGRFTTTEHVTTSAERTQKKGLGRPNPRPGESNA